VMAIVSPSQPSPAVIHRTSISLIDSLIKIYWTGFLLQNEDKKLAGRHEIGSRLEFVNCPGKKKGGSH